MSCSSCYKNLPSDGDCVTCGKCANIYHFDCSGLTKTTWKAKNTKSKNKWECQNCRSGKSRTQSVDSDTELEEPTILSLKRFIESMFKKQENTLIQRMDGMVEIINQLEERFHTTLDKVREIEEKTLTLEREISELKITLEMEKQYSRTRNFLITSIPKRDKEEARDTVVNILKSMEIAINKEEITAHRLPSKINPAPILVQCTSRESRDTIVRIARKLKPKVSQFYKDVHPDRAIFFNDHLTPYFSELMAKTNQARRSKGFKYIWMNGSKIMVKKDNLSKAIQVITHEDIEKIN